MAIGEAAVAVATPEPGLARSPALVCATLSCDPSERRSCSHAAGTATATTSAATAAHDTRRRLLPGAPLLRMGKIAGHTGASGASSGSAAKACDQFCGSRGG
ncbi:MAG TPA: hypothetical protein VK325_05700 [Pseudoxanthomonas sp.]|nr:hypothetical protein [Pseudoxanthomonas sp.]